METKGYTQTRWYSVFRLFMNAPW